MRFFFFVTGSDTEGENGRRISRQGRSSQASPTSLSDPPMDPLGLEEILNLDKNKAVEVDDKPVVR